MGHPDIDLNIFRGKGYNDVVRKLQDVMDNTIDMPKRRITEHSDEERQDDKRFKKAPECPVCFDSYKQGVHIYSCTSGGHFICGGCKESLPKQVKSFLKRMLNILNYILLLFRFVQDADSPSLSELGTLKIFYLDKSTKKQTFDLSCTTCNH